MRISPEQDLSRGLSSDKEELPSLLKASRERSWKTFGRRIRFYAPSFINYRSTRFHSSPTVFPSISITGSTCSLGCIHCQGKVLETMIPAPTPAILVEVARDLKKKGGVGMLISGGCLHDGSIPIHKFITSIAEIKHDLGLTVVVHTGLIKSPTVSKLIAAGVDAALIDVIGSDETIQEIYRLDARVDDYDESLRVLHESGIPFVPHVLVGLHYGKLKGEFQALRIISKYNPTAVIIIAFIPIKRTAMGTVPPPTPEAIARVIIRARRILPQTPLVLGCMRPLGTHRVKTDRYALEAGVNAIAFPTDEVIRLAESMGLKTTFSPMCCSQIFTDIADNHGGTT